MLSVHQIDPKENPMKKAAWSVYVLPSERASRLARRGSMETGIDFSGLNEYARTLCRTFFLRLRSLDPTQIRRVDAGKCADCG
jgi:hypothetical protein